MCQQGSLHMRHMSPSRFLQSHVSPILAVPWRSLRDHSWLWRPHVLAVLTCPASARHAHLRTSSEKFGYLAKSALNTGFEPKKFDKITSVDSDTMLIDDPDLNEISDFSKTQKQRKHASGNRLLDRQRERRFCDQCCRVDVKEKSTEQSWESFSSDSQRILFWRTSSPRTPWTRAQQALLGENPDQRRWDLTEYNVEIQNLERRNSEYALFESQRELEPQRWQLWEANPYADQARRERIRLCSE